MENDVLIQMVIMFFCIAILVFWFKKRWKKKPDTKVSPNTEDSVGGRWTAERLEPEPPERSSGPEPEPPKRSSGPEPEPPERSSGPEPEPPEKEPEPKE